MKITDKDKRFMQTAIDISVENVRNGGGPFGAVVVRNGEIVATGANRVTANNRPYGTCGSVCHKGGVPETWDVQAFRLCHLYVVRAMSDVSQCDILERYKHHILW